MQLAFHGATTIKADLEADILNSQQAGYSALADILSIFLGRIGLHAQWLL